MSRRDRLNGIFAHTAEMLAAANFNDEGQREPAGPVRSMALTLGRMEDETRELQEALIAGQNVRDLDPAFIEESFVRDRIGDTLGDEDSEFVRSIAENGQEVPILVRPHPVREGYYQVAYGHRRLKAARTLGIPVKAVVRRIADEDLVIAQGVENSARSDLSYIERACFAYALQERGFGRSVIMRALSTDKTELSKLLSVASAIPLGIVAKVGKAPSIGRRKWIAFAEMLRGGKDAAKLDALFASPAFQAVPSDERFEMTFDRLAGPAEDKASAQAWSPRSGGLLSGQIKATDKSYTLSLKAGDAALFGAFVTARLDALYDEFRQMKTGD